jgi:hypothetical protein
VKKFIKKANNQVKCKFCKNTSKMQQNQNVDCLIAIFEEAKKMDFSKESSKILKYPNKEEDFSLKNMLTSLQEVK